MCVCVYTHTRICIFSMSCFLHSTNEIGLMFVALVHSVKLMYSTLLYQHTTIYLIIYFFLVMGMQAVSDWLLLQTLLHKTFTYVCAGVHVKDWKSLQEMKPRSSRAQLQGLYTYSNSPGNGKRISKWQHMKEFLIDYYMHILSPHKSQSVGQSVSNFIVSL